jgi:hypothetical protein
MESVPGEDEVIATKKPFISGVVVGAVARRPIYTINVPVLEEDQVSYFLQLSIELQRLVDLLNANYLCLKHKVFDSKQSHPKQREFAVWPQIRTGMLQPTFISPGRTRIAVNDGFRSFPGSES